MYTCMHNYTMHTCGNIVSCFSKRPFVPHCLFDVACPEYRTILLLWGYEFKQATVTVVLSIDVSTWCRPLRTMYTYKGVCKLLRSEWLIEVHMDYGLSLAVPWSSWLGGAV